MTDSSALWVRRFHPRPHADCRLLCFPHAGGAASAYYALSAAVPSSVEVGAVQYPGRQDRRSEGFAEDVAALASGAVTASDDDRPVALFGHSMGAVVAFEAARLLESSDVDVLRLVVSGRAAPSTGIQDKDLDAWDDTRIVRELAGLGGTGSAQLEQVEVMEMMLPSLRADYRVLRAHEADPHARVACPITALTGDDDPTTPIASAEAWAGHTLGGFDLKVLSGGHFFLNDHEEELVALLTGRLHEDFAWARSFV